MQKVVNKVIDHPMTIVDGIQYDTDSFAQEWIKKGFVIKDISTSVYNNGRFLSLSVTLLLEKED